MRNPVENSGVGLDTVGVRCQPVMLITLLAPALFITALSGDLAAAPTVDAAKIVREKCAACHTETGNSVAPPFPKLAGMHAEYLAKEMRDFASGARKSEIMHPIMQDVKRNEIDPLAHYFAAQRRTPGLVSDPSLIPEGKRLYHEGNKATGVPACAGCHMEDGGGAPRFPMIAAQNSEYVAQQLRHFHTAERANDFGLLMRTVGGRLTESEIVAVSQYVASMPVVPAGR